ncbi:MAG: leucine-rich repeat domain-containing protein [Candidatus Poribacteria bacterium]|nr:leucine-rich repeat domain-containing protein [Candidatus Poribacteria bacterium]
MKGIKPIFSIFILIATALSASAQQELAQQAYLILENRCLDCHGPNGAFTENLVIDSATGLVDTGAIVPGQPLTSNLYTRLITTDTAKRMPLGQPPLDDAALQIISDWIAAGAPNWQTQHDVTFIPTDALLSEIQQHLQTLNIFDQPFARYFTMTHLYNAGETLEAHNAYQIALAKLVNSLSWGFDIHNPIPIDDAETIFYIDLRNYEWDIRDAWTQIENVYPYAITFDEQTQAGLHTKLATLQQTMNAEVPFVHVDWFLATASLPPLYHNILQLPETEPELERALGVDAERNLLRDPGRRVWRAGTNDSGVSNHNRVVERHTSRYGAYWKSHDFAGSAATQNIFTNPLDFQRDGGEVIFNLPNGLQGYYIADKSGNRIDVAPTEIVSNPAASDPAVHNGLSCIGCHTEGMKTITDQVRTVIEQTVNPPFDKDYALLLYVPQERIDALLAEDTARYKTALEETGGVFGGIEPVHRFYEAFQDALEAPDAAGAVGLQTDVFLTQISQKSSLQNLGLTALTGGGSVKRDAWTQNFSEIITALQSPDTPVTTTPDTVRPIPPTPGRTVQFPDPNLRAAIADALGKAPGDPITVAEIATLKRLDANNKDISDLTGLESAMNLRWLAFSHNTVSDLSPIAKLTNLTFLWFEGSRQVSDISPLTRLTNLEKLHFSSNSVSDLSPIKGLINLTHLEFNWTSVSDLSILVELSNLEWFRMWGHAVSDLSPLAELTKLEWVEICGGRVSDLTPLAGLTRLKRLAITQEPLVDISPLAELTHLEKLYLEKNEISDISSLARLTNLRELRLQNNKIFDISPLARLTNLQELNLQDNLISDISPLAGLNNLGKLDLRDNPVSDLSHLEELFKNPNIEIFTTEVYFTDPNLRAAIAEELNKTQRDPITTEEMATLQYLFAGDKNISDLTGLEFAKNLIVLGIGDNPLSDLSPLASLTKLRELHFHDTEVADLSPLSGLLELEIIDVSETRIRSLAPLAGLKNLQKLDTVGADITDLSPLAGLTKLTRLRLYAIKATDLSPLKGLTKLKWLGLTHNDHITDFLPLSRLTELRHLDLFNTHIVDVSPLSGLVNLETLILSENRIVDVSPLASLRNLKTLELHVNNISDFSPLDPIRETIEVFTWYSNPGFPQGGPKIAGPWLWLTLPANRGEDILLTDYLAKASNSKITEQQIATFGALDGAAIGESVWSVGTLEPYKADGKWSNVKNLKRLLDAQGAIELSDGEDFVVYGSITLYAPRTQQTKIFIGASEPRKVYLNGKLVHEDDADHNARSWAYDYQTFFPITLQPGKNVLLIKLGDEWDNDILSLFFGLEPDTEYKIFNPSVGYSFSDSKIHVGDTFTLDLSAENVFDLAGWQFDIAFDPAVLEAIEVNEGDFLKESSGTTFFQKGTIDNATGKIIKLSSARLNEDGVAGTGTLLSVTFTAKAAGETRLSLNNFQLGSVTGEAINAGPHEFVFTIDGQLATGDVNRDGQVSVLDLILVSRHLGEDAAASPQADVNNDGIINIQDLIVVAQHLGESTDAAAPAVITAINNGELTPAIIETWIEKAHLENDGSLAFQQGIANLQRLLAVLIPEEMALLANYPNPFNPETWIPYQLAKPAEVTLTFYAANGAVVRTFALGHQAAGMYHSRSRAAYWDGRNEVGEPVASGVYFYTLRAGDFSATRRMLIRK